jgi:hypothetical protein
MKSRCRRIRPEDEGRFDVASVVLVQALGVEKVDVRHGRVCDFDRDTIT